MIKVDVLEAWGTEIHRYSQEQWSFSYQCPLGNENTSHRWYRERSLGHLKQLILLQLNATNFLCIAALQEVASHLLPNLSKQKTWKCWEFTRLFLSFFSCRDSSTFITSLTLVCQILPRATPDSDSDLVSWHTQSPFENTKNLSCPPRARCVCLGVGVRAFKGPTASFLPPSQSLTTRPLMPVDSFILHDPTSPLELVHVLPAFPFPPPGALTLRQRNAFLKRQVISHPFQTVYLIRSPCYTQRV